MNRRMNFKGIITLSLAAAMLSGTFAFAQTVNAEDSVMLISENMEEEISVSYAAKYGTVTGVEAIEGGISIMLEDGDMGLIVNVEEGAYVMNAEDGTFKSVEEIEEGMNLTVVINEFTPMTMSIPPMINMPDAIIVSGENCRADVLKFGNDLVSEDGNLMLNISPETVITDIRGSRRIFTEADVKGATAVVVYSFATMSIPAQTNPERIIILNEGKTETVGLRDTAEKAGYDVKWTGNDKEVVLSKDGVEIKVLCGSAVAEKTDLYGIKTSTVLKEAVYLENSKMMVSSDIESLF